MRRRAGAAALLAPLAVVAVASAAPAPALAQTRFEFHGRGFGHGVGMSQWGARGAALAGWDQDRILAHYYRDTRLERRAGRPVRVLLAQGRAPATVGVASPGAAVDIDGTRVALSPGVAYRVRPVAGRIQLVAPGRPPALLAPPARLNAPAGVIVGVAGRRYRGGLVLRAAGPGLRIVNVVGLERYLAGVVPGEMPPAWGDDAPASLRAQAVAARSYTEATRHPERDFDLYADVRSQVYTGLSGEDRRATRAVRATSGRVLTHAGAPIAAFYSSSSGGRTADVGESFDLPPRPYLRGVGDPFDRIAPDHRWGGPSLTGAEIGRRLGLGAPVRGIALTLHRPGGRVARAVLVTADGRRHALRGPDLRRGLGLRSSWIVVARRPA